MRDLDQLEHASPEFANFAFDSPLLIYGAGGAGRSVAANLKATGIKVEGFIDARAGVRDFRDGLRVVSLGDWLKSGDPSATDILVGIHSPLADVGEVVDQLRGASFRRVLTMVDYINSVEDPTFRYWLAPASHYRDKKEAIGLALGLFSEPASREWFVRSLTTRLLGDYGSLPRPSFEDQYAPADLPRWSNPIRLIDCGAYNGDSIERFRSAGYEIESLVALEPDPTNYSELVERCSVLVATLLPCGVSDTAQRISFSADQGPSGRVGEPGAEIQCVAIDEALQGFRPNLIKMDIEGSEPAALRGAARTIGRSRPGLAISIYHEPDHLWEIPLYVSSLNLGYRMYLRGHSHNGFDLVLYCLAE